MKRSLRFKAKARRAALHACVSLSVTFAGCVWLIVATMPEAAGGLLVVPVAAVGLCLTAGMARECAWHLRQSHKEARWEFERETRTRL